ncbi:MAG: twin-arginine translocation signal domain-containing protein [bacterium]
MSIQDKSVTRRDFLRKSSIGLAAVGGITIGCNSRQDSYNVTDKTSQSNNVNPSSWWHKDEFVIHKTVDAKSIDKGTIRAFIDGSWREFKIIELPEEFITWSLETRVARLGRMIRFGGLDPRDLAGSHNACVATYGGPSRDSSVSLNTAYKGMGFTVHANRVREMTQKINEERNRIERNTMSNHSRLIHDKVRFLADFYRDQSIFDRTKQVSLELFTSPEFHTHTFLNMMANPITSASFLAFPTFEIRAIPQLLHPRNPWLSEYEKDLIAYTNEIHDFIHSGPGERITCVYHVIELFDDTPNDMSKGKRVA